MAGRVLLDTNIVIALFAGEERIRERLVQRQEVFLPSTVIGELCYGALKSERAEANLARIDELASVCVVLPCDRTTAQYYGEIKHLLRTKGHPIPDNDVWIAAVAEQ
ncbi:MAG: type II toxin-antitoxin system VapC family toxin [Terriglobia bacterium]|jgi:tRNA(fMet)-specific endonuclease VapC